MPSVSGPQLWLVGTGEGAVIGESTLLIHILAGAIALLAGLAAIMTAKGGQRHNQAGKLYAVAMAVVVVTAVPLSIWAANWFLFAIAVFTGYLIASGYRVIVRRRAGLIDSTAMDYRLHGTMLLAAGGMIVGGGYGAVTGLIALGEVLVVFGGIGGILAIRELAQFRRARSERTPWFERHIAFMGGAYIATVTATVTVNLTMVPPLARWLGPTVVGGPLITYAVVSYRRRFGYG